MTNLLVSAALAAACLCGAPSAQESSDPYAWDCPGTGWLPFRSELLVSTERLARMVEEGRVTIVHVGCDPSSPDPIRRVGYSEGHIPGARFLSWPDLAPSGPGPSLGSHLDVFRALGISPDLPVVFYDTGRGCEAAAAYAALDALGLAGRAALLDGQWSKWASEGRPLSRAYERPAPSVLERGPSGVRVGHAELSVLARGECTLVDARTAAGRRPFGSGTVVRMSWIEHLAAPAWPVVKGEAALRRVWGAAPPLQTRPLVVGAGRWTDAAPVYFAAKLLGYPARILDGAIDAEDPEDPLRPAP